MNHKMPTPSDLLQLICDLGQGELHELTLRDHLRISHGYFCRLRSLLVQEGRLIVTHPHRKACYFVPAHFEDEPDEAA